MTAAAIRRRLSGLALPVWGATPNGALAAAVLVPLVAHDRGVAVLLTRRTEHLADHPGQVAFPGGRHEPGDADPAATALRETEEEIGLRRGRIEVLGGLAPLDTATGFVVTPVIGLVAPPLSLSPDPAEVAEAFEVPLTFLLDPASRRIERRRRRGRAYRGVAFDYGGRTIWGATARMVVALAEALGR